MSRHTASISWTMSGPSFTKGQFSRAHEWRFDGGARVPASPSPLVVPPPWSDPSCVDPEEAFVAAVASCHMLTFLWLASKGGFVVESYQDEAVGEMTKNERGVPWVSAIVLQPRIGWGADAAPSAAELAALHHRAHEQCIIANSVRTAVTVAPPGDST